MVIFEVSKPVCLLLLLVEFKFTVPKNMEKSRSCLFSII